MAARLDIGEVRRRTGLSASALRFYEERGLIHSVAREGLRRQYKPDVIDELAVIVLCRDAGFTLAEISALLATRGDVRWKAIATRKRDELRAQAARLERLAEQLDHALECPSRNVLRCEHFRAVLDHVFDATVG
jgi:DNA-binding transcriptional MerR regulator